MGRTASGVRGISLDGSKCICSEIVKEDDTILLVTEKGYGKQTKVSEYRQTRRGSKGVKAMNITEKNGRATQGTRLIHLKDNQKVSTISLVDKEEEPDIVSEPTVNETPSENTENIEVNEAE